MSKTMDDNIKRWTAKRKTARVVVIIQGKTTVSEASRVVVPPLLSLPFWVQALRSELILHQFYFESL